MPSSTMVTRDHSHGDGFGLAAIAEHNASGTEQFPSYSEGAKGLGIYQDGYAPAYQDSHSYVQSPPTPSPSDGVRTRSGRTTRRTDSPFSTSKSRMSMSPISNSKRTKKSKLDKSKTPQLTAPLSVLTKDMEVPMKDMDEWVHRPADVRRQEVEKRNGYVTRPMNSFMLYRSAYAERTKQWCLQNNHQVVSSVSGESWPMEPPEVRDQFNEWAKIERANHAAAHPDYKFSPSKATSKRRKDEDSDDDEPDGFDDPDGEYCGGRNVRQKRQHNPDPALLPSSHGFESTPYYSQPAYEHAQYQYVTAPGRPLPSNIAFDPSGLPYNPQTGAYIQSVVSQQPQYQYAVQEPLPPREPTPQSLGTYGLPSGQPQDQLFATSSRTSTPMQQQYNQYGQPIYPQYTTTQQAQQYSQTYQAALEPAMYEHQQYLQAQLQPQQAIDPSLEIMLNDAAAANGQESHFESAMGDLTTGDLGVLEYYDQQTSPDATLAPPCSPTDGLK